MDFFGRESEMSALMNLWGKRGGSLITCRGRRRIGKSTLVERFAKKSKARFIKIEGARPRLEYTNATELRVFAEQLAACSRAERLVPESWLQAFVRLDREIVDKERTVVLLDEISWLGRYDETFADMVKIAWDNYWSKHDRLVVVICGSVSSWIKEHFVDNGAFFGRRSMDLVVRELPLSECVKFWGKTANRIDPKEIVDVLSVTGGVPRYLREINPGVSAAENIRRMAYAPNSILRIDFDEMFTDVITRLEQLSGRIMRVLVTRALSLTEIAEALGVEKNGKLSKALVQLCEAGLLQCDAYKNPETGEDARETQYRIRDNYSRFYLKYVEPQKTVIDNGVYSFVALEALDGWNVQMGLQFENLVLNNYAALIGPLQIGNALVESVAPYRRTRKADGAEGLQIDILLQTKRCNFVIEVKRQRQIGREVIDEVEAKIRKLATPRGKSARAVLVYEGELASVVETEGYFDALIPFRQLLGL